ncbi:MAG: zf-TFIIB domain-containing protein [Labilithrix sp.]|nr:zf-TFIIB domain-containing protein [Labilithrix sp.]MBX3225576.1 zf-TFIIB domain-containing protein [Labilithrix sp.]
MDLAGRGPAYRGVTVRCPGCAAPMRCEAVPSAEIDVCDACGGLWVDWFDGDVHTVAAEVEAARVNRGAALAPGEPNAGARTCPRCTRALELELFRFTDASEHELVNGVELLRCPECAGSFVPRSSAHLLLDRVREPRVVTLWEALVGVLRRLVGASPR